MQIQWYKFIKFVQDHVCEKIGTSLDEVSENH